METVMEGDRWYVKLPHQAHHVVPMTVTSVSVKTVELVGDWRYASACRYVRDEIVWVEKIESNDR